MRDLTCAQLERIFGKWTRWEGEHLLWTGTVYLSGRANQRNRQRRGHVCIYYVMYSVTRVALELYLRRPIAPGMYALHTRDCTNPLCLRFEHLYEGTQYENMQDAMVMRGSSL